MPIKKIKILVIEDNRLLRDGIAAMVKKQPDMHVVATIANGEKILTAVKKLKPNIVLLDFSLKNHSSLNVVKLIKKNFQNIKIIIMDLLPLQPDVLEFVQAGVSGFILKDAGIKEFFKTIRLVFQGTQVLPPNLTGSLFTQIFEHSVTESKSAVFIGSIHLTKRELQVIELISDGFTNKEIAEELRLSTYTVKSHVHNILEKLTLHTRLQIAKYVHLSEVSKIENDNDSLSNE
jgi:two-component system NarL family response regulator